MRRSIMDGKAAAGPPRVSVTSGVFRWLCEIQAVSPEHGEGCPAGGVLLTAEGGRAIMGGATLLDSVARFCPAAAKAIAEAGQLAELHFRIAPQAPTSAANRLHNWQSILWIMSRVTGEEIDPDEKSLLVAQDTAIVSCVLHRLAAQVALSAAIKAGTLLDARPTSALRTHAAVQLLCPTAERHLNVDASTVARLMLQEPDKYVYMLLNPAKLPAKPTSAGHGGGGGAVEEFLRDMHVRSSDVADALRRDESAFDLVLWAVSRPLLSLHRSDVIGAARAVGSIADAHGGAHVSEWLLSSPRAGGGGWYKPGQDGLSVMLGALYQHPSDADVALAVGHALYKCCRAQNIPALLSIELVARVRANGWGAGGEGAGDGNERLGPVGNYCKVVGDLLPALAAEEKGAQELEWYGAVPLLVNFCLHDLRRVGAGFGAGGGARRTAVMRLLVETWRAFPRALIASGDMVQSLLAALRLSLASGSAISAQEGAGPTLLTQTFRGACDLLLVMIELKCSVAGHLYNLLAQGYQQAYAHTLTRHQLQADLRRALTASSHMPCAPLVRPLPSLVASFGWADAGGGGGTGRGVGGGEEYDVVVKGDVVYQGDLGFWRLLAQHPRSQPAEVMAMLQLLSHTMLTDSSNSGFAGASIQAICRTLVRHASVRAFLERSLAGAIAALALLCAKLPQPPHGAIYAARREDAGGATAAMHSHVRALQNFVTGVGASEGSRPLAVEALRQALSGGRVPLDAPGRDELVRLLDIVQGPHHLSVTPSLLPPVAGATPSPPPHASAHAAPSPYYPAAHAAYASSPSPAPGGGYAGEVSPVAYPPAHEHGGVDQGPAPRSQGGGYGELESRRKASRQGGPRPEGDGVRVEKAEKKVKKERKREENPVQVEEPKKERARDKKAKKPAAQGDAACVEAFKVRAFKTAEEVFALLLPDDTTRVLTGNTSRDSLKALKLSAQIQAQLFKGLGWDKKPSRKVTPLEFVQVFGWSEDVGEGVIKPSGGEQSAARDEDEVLDAVDLVLKHKREVASAVRKRLGDADKMLKKKVAENLEEALVRCAEIASLSAPPPGEAPQPVAKKKVSKPVKKVPPPKRVQVVETEPPKPLFKLEKTVLEVLVRANPLLQVEADVDDSWVVASPRVLTVVPRQLIRLHQLDKACHVCCSLHWVQQAIREVGVHSVLETLNSLWQALHAGQGREIVDDYLDFLEINAEALSLDPSRIFVLALHQHAASAVHVHCNKAVVNGDSMVRQAAARVQRLQGSSVSPIHKALSCSRSQRALARLISRGITRCFSKAQKERLAKNMTTITAALQEVMQDVKTLEPEALDEALAGVFGSWQQAVTDDFGTRLDAHGRALLMYDLMDVLLTSWAPPLAAPLPPAPLPLCAPEDEESESQADLRCSEGAAFAEDDELEQVFACWPEVRVFVGASSPDVSHERKFLLDFVLPALRMQACSRRVCLSWVDPPLWRDPPADGGEAMVAHVRQVALARLRLLQGCRICPQAPAAMEDGSPGVRGARQPLAVLVLGQRVGEPLLPGRVLKDAVGATEKSLALLVGMCVCVCARARACVCVCVCVCSEADCSRCVRRC